MPSPEQIWLTVSDPQDGVYWLLLLHHKGRGEELLILPWMPNWFLLLLPTTCMWFCTSGIGQPYSHRDTRIHTGYKVAWSGKAISPTVRKPSQHTRGWNHLCSSKSTLTCALQASPVTSWFCRIMHQWNYCLWGVGEVLSECVLKSWMCVEVLTLHSSVKNPRVFDPWECKAFHWSGLGNWKRLPLFHLWVFMDGWQCVEKLSTIASSSG